jgi:pimeloyl-ACP methyl ester carboxylesterase
MDSIASLMEVNARRLHDVAHGMAERLVPNAGPLAPAIDAEPERLPTPAELTCYVDREHPGRPLVLLHSINACASSYEMRPLFEHYRASRPVYALDLPGFGLSAREERTYSIDLYVDSIRELLGRVKDRDGAADVVALSLTGEFAARVASTPEPLVRTLTLLSPTGFQKGTREYPALGIAKRIIRQPIVAPLLFDVLASRPSIAYFLGRSFVGHPDEGLLAYAYATSHQPGAYRAPIAFLTGDLFARDARESVYPRVSVPTLVVYDRDGFTRFDALAAFVQQHPRWRAQRVAPTRGMPQFEQLAKLASALEAFWGTAARDAA